MTTSKKITQLILGTPKNDDTFVYVSKVGNSTFTTNQTPVQNAFANVDIVVKSVTPQLLNISHTRSTPLSSTDTVTEGTIWFDNSYLYIATANNSIKRVSLSSF